MADVWNPNLYKSNHSFVYNYGKALLELLDPQSHDEILDIGCGTGELTNEIFKKTKSLTAVDASDKMINEAKKSYPGINFIKMNALEMEYKNKFNKVFSNAVFHWIFDHEKFLEKIHTSLKMNGKLVVEMGGQNNTKTILSALKTALINNGYIENSKKQLTFFPSVGEYTSLLEKAGFTVRYVLYFDRETELIGEDGLKTFINMFCSPYFEDIDEIIKNKILDEVKTNSKNLLFKKGKWYADYKRLRFVAEKI